jgi:hypothetical protein
MLCVVVFTTHLCEELFVFIFHEKLNVTIRTVLKHVLCGSWFHLCVRYPSIRAASSKQLQPVTFLAMCYVLRLSQSVGPQTTRSHSVLGQGRVSFSLGVGSVLGTGRAGCHSVLGLGRAGRSHVVGRVDQIIKSDLAS